MPPAVWAYLRSCWEAERGAIRRGGGGVAGEGSGGSQGGRYGGGEEEEDGGFKEEEDGGVIRMDLDSDGDVVVENGRAKGAAANGGLLQWLFVCLLAGAGDWCMFGVVQS